ncbi:hypothetical protein Syun_019611 [Stephania yunnanensis]|uniref:TF-B3 domain-containing protein n=1 Tax=Stephania yunnanensis TaxID=152371 RepID=A0AAP0IUI0_9MAGN
MAETNYQGLLGEPDMPNRMRRAIDKLAINDENPTWVGSKKVLGNDSKVRLGRLVLPGESKLDELLRAEEKGRSVYTKMVDGDGEVWELDFNYWPSLKRYVFKREWAKILKKFGVETGWIVQIWCFRSTQNKPCFGVNVVNPLVNQKF